MTETDHLGPPPIEPLSDTTWSRVERGLWARIDAARLPARAAAPARRWIWIAAPALAAAAAIAVLALGADGDHDAHEVTARLVSHEAPTSLSLGDVHVTLDADSAVVMSSGRSAVLERGGAAFAIAPRGAQPPFVVAAGDAVVRVVGTRFHVARYGEAARVIVERGTVEVLFRGATKRVGAGEQWSSQQPAEVTAVVAAALEAPEGSGEEPAPAAPSGSGEAPPAAAPASTAEKRRPAPAAAPPAPAPAPVVDAHADREQARFRQLEALEAQYPRAAIEGYLVLSRGESRWAERALFAAARLAADREEPRAKLLLDIYLQRFPRGANAADARTLLDLIQGARR